MRFMKRVVALGCLLGLLGVPLAFALESVEVGVGIIVVCGAAVAAYVGLILLGACWDEWKEGDGK